jgi:hypothetical protein
MKNTGADSVLAPGREGQVKLAGLDLLRAAVALKYFDFAQHYFASMLVLASINLKQSSQTQAQFLVS